MAPALVAAVDALVAALVVAVVAAVVAAKVGISMGQPRCFLRRIMHVFAQPSIILLWPPVYRQKRLQCVASPKAAFVHAAGSVVEEAVVDALLVVAAVVTQPRSIMRRVKQRSTHASLPDADACDKLQRAMQCLESRARMQPAVVVVVGAAVVATVVRNVTQPLSWRRAVTHCAVHVSSVQIWRRHMSLHWDTAPRLGLVRRACWHEPKHTPE